MIGLRVWMWQQRFEKVVVSSRTSFHILERHKFPAFLCTVSHTKDFYLKSFVTALYFMTRAIFDAWPNFKWVLFSFDFFFRQRHHTAHWLEKLDWWNKKKVFQHREKFIVLWKMIAYKWNWDTHWWTEFEVSLTIWFLLFSQIELLELWTWLQCCFMHELI